MYKDEKRKSNKIRTEIVQGMIEADDLAALANDSCGDPHCCECGDGNGCPGCFFCTGYNADDYEPTPEE